MGEEVTLADLFAASSLSRGFMYVWGREWQEGHPVVTRWFRDVTGLRIWRDVVPNPVIVEEAVRYDLERSRRNKD